MYAHCLFCHTDLGRNEVIESFPVGRRLAFDSANGRFWVICPSCKRWNLSPLEERWDAMDACERLYEGTRLRMSTDNIGLARVGEGTELVRVGKALRPEMAAWRFSAQLAARRRKYRLLVAGGVVLVGGVYAGAAAAGLGAGAFQGLWQLVHRGYERATRLVLPTPEERLVNPPGVLYRSIPELLGRRERAIVAPRIETKHAVQGKVEPVEGGLSVTLPIVGRDTVRYDAASTPRVLAKLLAKVNRSGGSKTDERTAVEMLARVADRHVPDLASGLVDEWSRTTLIGKPLKEYGWRAIALEMALQEQRERELLAGELLDLESAWREAEELARIADTLVPTSIDQALARLKARMDG